MTVHSAWLMLPLMIGWLSGEADAAPEAVSAETRLAYDQEWAVWVGSTAPSGWPPSVAPAASTPGTSLLPDTPGNPHPRSAAEETSQGDPDRVLQLGPTPGGAAAHDVWITGLHAPFSVWTAASWEDYFPTWLKGRKRHLRRGKRYSRTAMVHPATGAAPGVPPAQSAYFVNTFDLDDAARVVSVELGARYKAGLQLFINGKPVVVSRIEEATDGTLRGVIEASPAPWIENTVAPTGRWEQTWLDIDPSVLRTGTNVIAAHTVGTGDDGAPVNYFDATLRVHDQFTWSKVPYLHGVGRDRVTLSWETTAPSDATVSVTALDGDYRREYPVSARQRLHELRLEGLRADTRYRYEVRPGRSATHAPIEPFSNTFRTAPDPDASFSFLLYGDSRWGTRVHRALADQMVADAQTHDIGLVVHTGDIVSVGYDWQLWQERFFAPAGPLLSTVPLYPAPGNHEKNAQLYYDYFDLPGVEAWYHFRYGIADFYALNTNVDFSPGSEQYRWFVDALKAGEGRWKVVMMHHPPFSCADDRKPGARLVVRDLVPLFEEHGVDLVLLGHDHVYGRSGDINGVHYLISGGGGSALYSSTEDDKMVRCEKRYNYVRLRVDPSRISWIARDEKGDLIEEYVIE